MPALLERESELAAFRRGLREGLAGHGQLLVIEGPPGQGKTTLLRAAREEAVALGYLTLRSRSTELERDHAFGSVRQLLEPAVVRASLEERERLLAGTAGAAAVLFEPLVHEAPEQSSYAVLHGLYWLVDALTRESPVLLALDDIHWADPESLRFLTFLAPRMEGVRLVIVAAARAGAPQPEDLVRLVASPETTVIRPRPLSLEATADLCRDRLGVEPGREFAEACHEVTAGNPYYLTTLLEQAGEIGLTNGPAAALRVREAGPAPIAQAVLLRLADMRDEAAPVARTVIRSLAVLGEDASLGEVAEHAGIDAADAAHAIDLLARHDLVRLEGARIEFVHPIVREAVHSDIAPAARAAAHERAAETLRRSGAAEERIAGQLLLCSPAGDPERVSLLRRVAATALTRGAPDTAVSMLRRALAEPPDPEQEAEVLLALGSAELTVAAPEAVERLSAAAARIRDPTLRATAARRLAHALTRASRADESVDVIAAAADAVAAEDREQALLLEAEVTFHADHASRDRRIQARERLARLGPLAGETAGERMVLASRACELARDSESAAEALGHLEGVLAAWRPPARDLPDLPGLLYNLTIQLIGAEAFDLADEILEHVLADARRRGSVSEIGYLTCWRGWSALGRGAIDRADADAAAALELFTGHRVLGARFALGLLVLAMIEAGDLGTAERALADSGIGEDIPPSRASNYLLEARGRLRLAHGRAEDALADLFEFGRRDQLWGGGNPRASGWRSHAVEALAAAGRSGEARTLAEEELARAQRWGASGGLGRAMRVAALVTADRPSLKELERAADFLADSPARLEHARALIDLGAERRRRKRLSDARPVLREGLRIATGCGARAEVDRATVELRAAGDRATEGTGLGELTVSERRVAELAAEGLSNPAIAQTLFVTRKTVETHLSRIYRKLGIRTRGELPGALVGARD